jgi:hypothetical protein
MASSLLVLLSALLLALLGVATASSSMQMSPAILRSPMAVERPPGHFRRSERLSSSVAHHGEALRGAHSSHPAVKYLVKASRVLAHATSALLVSLGRICVTPTRPA